MKNGYTLFLSGVEPEENFYTAIDVTSSLLQSYWYIKRRGKDKIVERFDKVKKNSLLIDSGAHTFLTLAEYQDKTVDYWEEYIKGYIAFVRKHREKVFACVEMDIDTLVGTEQVNKWREEYFHSLEEEGIPVIYVYHAEKGLEEWERMCKTYSYVGFSYNEFEDAILIDKLFEIAMEYKTKVHGFAVSGYRELLKHEYYTSDSTSWITGAQYGELNYFEGGKLKRLTKEKWKNEYYAKILDLCTSKKLLEAEAPYELMRISALSYKKLEEHVNDIFRGKRYWIGRKEVSKVASKGNLPPVEWFSTDMEDWQEWAQKLNIDTNLPDEAGKSLIVACYNFVTDNPIINEYPLEELIDLCGLFGDKKSNTLTKCRKALKEHFTALLKGSMDLSTLTEEEVEEKKNVVPKEREEYVQEKEYVECTVSKEECQGLLKGLLTSGVTDEAEKALIEQGIEPIYDENGNIKAGIKRIKKRKSLSSSVMPELSCNICTKARRCPLYEEGMLCAYNKMFKQFDTRNSEDVVDAMSSIANLSLERLSRAVTFEKLDGGLNTKEVTETMAEAWKYLEKIQEIQTKSDKVIAERRVVTSSNGDVEVRESVTGNPQGLLSEILKTKKS